MSIDNIDELHLEKDRVFALAAQLENVGSLYPYLATARNEVLKLQQPFALRDVLEREGFNFQWNMIYDTNDIAEGARKLESVAVGLLTAIAEIMECDLISAQSYLNEWYKDTREETTLEKFGLAFFIIASASLAIATFGSSLAIESTFLTAGLAINGAIGLTATTGSLAIAYEQYDRGELDLSTLIAVTALTVLVGAGNSGLVSKLIGKAIALKGTSTALEEGAVLAQIAEATKDGSELSKKLLSYAEMVENNPVIAGKSISELSEWADRKLFTMEAQTRLKEEFGLTDAEIDQLALSFAMTYKIQNDKNSGKIDVTGDIKPLPTPTVSDPNDVDSANFARLITWLKAHDSNFKKDFKNQIDFRSALFSLGFKENAFDDIPPDLREIARDYSRVAGFNGYLPDYKDANEYI